MASKEAAKAADPKPDPTCASCPCWQHRPHLGGILEMRKGHCRRFPPAASGAIGPGAFAMTAAGDYCFEHPELAARLSLDQIDAASAQFKATAPTTADV